MEPQTGEPSSRPQSAYISNFPRGKFKRDMKTL